MTQLDQLLQKYEFENSQISKAILTERDKLAIVQRQRRENEKKISEFENIISNLETEIGREMKYEVEKEREIERLKNETYILRDHRNTKRDKLDKQRESYQKMIARTEEMIRESSQKYDSYMEKYETIPWANKFLSEKAKTEDMRKKIEQTNETMLALNQKENELRKMSEQKDYEVGKLDIQAKKLLIESAEFRKNAVLKYKQITAKRISEMKYKQSLVASNSNNPVNQLELKGRRSLLERHLINVTPLRPLQSDKRIQRDSSSPQEYLQDPKDSCNNSLRQIEDTDASESQTSTPKLVPRFSPGVQLSPLTMLLGNSCPELPFSSPEPSQRMKTRSIPVFNPQALTISPITSPSTLRGNTPARTPTIAGRPSTQMRPRIFSVDSPLTINRSSPFPIENETSVSAPASNLAISNNLSNHNLHFSSNAMKCAKQTRKENYPEQEEGGRKESPECANGQRREDQEFRFGFMDETPHSSNPFCTDSPDPKMGNSKGSSDFPSLFTGSGILSQAQEASDNPFSFVP